MSTPKKGISRKQMIKQIKMLYDLMMETRQVVMNLTQRYEEMKIRMVSEWETVVEILVEEHGMLEDDISQKLGDKFTGNVDKYNKILEERMQELVDASEEQVAEVTKQAEEFMEKQGISLEDVEDEEGEDVEVSDNALKAAAEED